MLIMFFCEGTSHSCDPNSNATVPGELHDVLVLLPLILHVTVISEKILFCFVIT